MRRAAVVFVGLLFAICLFAAASLGELFQKVKEQVKAGAWADALVTMEVLDVEAAKPGNEKAQEQLAGPLSFYRGVCDANLDNAAKAQADFEMFLGLQANASIDDKMYSKKAVAAFAAAQKSIVSAGPSIARAYAAFKPPANSREPASPTWGDGPVVWLMSDSEKAGWAAAATDADRAAFVETFWKARNLEDDPTFQPAFEKRVAFADANFAVDDKSGKKRGSMTDRGMVFVLLGPPTYGGRRRLKAGEDKSQNSGMSSVDDHASYIAQKQLVAAAPGNKVMTGQLASTNDRYVGPGTEAADQEMNFQEVWHYRKELLPKTVSYLQVDATFITKKGYGVQVLQRDSDILTTLSAAKQKPQ
ncbi:MAG TPA: GWxTD domain-containing protein [Thermoanaerobaculia bacterium]|jgi:GWxTD domain-containing protein|nr:GWxTD domain-containing protein [Thermoanaerobaculia bacterium]